MCLFSTGFLAPAASMLAIGFINCENRGVAIAMFCVGEGLSSFSRCGLYTICMELAPRFVIYFISKYIPTHTIYCTYIWHDADRTYILIIHHISQRNYTKCIFMVASTFYTAYIKERNKVWCYIMSFTMPYYLWYDSMLSVFDMMLYSLWHDVVFSVTWCCINIIGDMMLYYRWHDIVLSVTWWHFICDMMI